MALSASLSRRLRATQLLATQVVSGSTIYRGSFAALGSGNHGTAGNIGRVYPYNDEQGAIYWGLCGGGGGSGPSQGADSVVGDATYDNVASLVQESFVVEGVAVTGLAGTAADVGKYVHLTDDTTLTLTRPTIGCPLGIVVQHNTSSKADVLFFSVQTVISIVAGGCAKHDWMLGHFLCADMNDALQLTALAPHAGTITAFYASVTKAPAGTAGTVSLKVTVGSTDVGPSTPATCVVATGDAKGDRKASAAITANNKFKEGDTIKVTGTSTTTMSAGSFSFHLVYIAGPGL